MGNYMYCDSCGAGLNPTLKDKLLGIMQCSCTEFQCLPYPQMEKEQAIEELVDRLEAVEKKLGLVA